MKATSPSGGRELTAGWLDRKRSNVTPLFCKAFALLARSPQTFRIHHSTYFMFKGLCRFMDNILSIFTNILFLHPFLYIYIAFGTVFMIHNPSFFSFPDCWFIARTFCLFMKYIYLLLIIINLLHSIIRIFISFRFSLPSTPEIS